MVQKSVILGLPKVLRALEKLEHESKRKNNGNVIVGYSASYAVHVHEDMNAKHNEGQKAKYLEQPAREIQGELGTIIKGVVKGGGSVIQGLLVAGLRLQRESQKLVPVDTGNLKASAFTEKE